MNLSFLSSLIFSCISLLGINICQAKDEKPTPPNIILIISDDAGYADFGFTGGSDLIKTPNLDKMAAEGAIFSQGYVTASVCCPSRMGLMTGRYQQRFGAECNVPTLPTPGFTKEDLGMDLGEKTMGNLMQAQGYNTLMVGKWHLGEDEKYHPLKRGFDEFYGFLGGSRSYWPIEKPRRGTQLMHNFESLDEEKAVSYLTDDLTDASLDFIDRNHAKPFFIYLSYNAVHTPMHAKEEDIEQQTGISDKKRRIYAAMTTSMDENIGRLRKHLAEKKLDKNTLLVFINDNGGAGSNASENAPLRGFKGTYWEGGIRVPYVMTWPGKIKPGTQYPHPVSTLDLLPSFLSVAGAKPNDKLDGKDLMPYLLKKQKGPAHEYLFWRMWRAAAVRHGDWKLIRLADDPLEEKRKILAPLILVNISEDPEEKNNLADQHPEIRDRLLAALENWETGLTQPRWYDGRDWRHWAERQVKNHQMD